MKNQRTEKPKDTGNLAQITFGDIDKAHNGTLRVALRVIRNELKLRGVEE